MKLRGTVLFPLTSPDVLQGCQPTHNKDKTVPALCHVATSGGLHMESTICPCLTQSKTYFNGDTISRIKSGLPIRRRESHISGKEPGPITVAHLPARNIVELVFAIPDA
jgi:hypothetical protein